jgi:hypothetical protein
MAMLRDQVEDVAAFDAEMGSGAAPTWAPTSRRNVRPDWRVIDRALRTIGKRRAALDADEARWLREAERVQIWRPLGMVSMIDYLERTLGYAPRTAQDRLRVARALGNLSLLTVALAGGELGFSAVRELTRVATPTTEAEWIAAAAGKNLREIEELVADHRPGDRPDDPPDPEARLRMVRLELSPETFALLRQTHAALDDEHGTHLSDDAFVAALCGTALAPVPDTEPSGRAKFQIAMTVCERCRQGWQEGAGAQIAVDTAAVDRAMCDAQHIGSIDGPVPGRAHQDVAPSVARLIWRRDGGRCRVDGCRSARGIEIHHVVHREHGGSHEAANLVLLCSSCHLAHHRGALAVRGSAEHLVVERPAQGEAQEPAWPARQAQDPGQAVRQVARRASTNGVAHAHVGAQDQLGLTTLRDEARRALTGLGWKPAIAQAAVADAASSTPAVKWTLERLIFEALRRCPKPTG